MQLRLTVDYDGTAYRGWQRQPDGPTVQEVLEKALATALREPVRARAAGRTDAGVHASGQVVAVRITRAPSDVGRLQRSLNALVPPDVAVRELTVVDDAFDPRRDARARVYEYRILNAPVASPFWRRCAWHVARPLDVAAMDVAAAALLGEHDFAAFRAADPAPPRSTVRRVFESRVRERASLIVYRIEATAFLKHMVRNIVGTLVEIGRAERTAESMQDVLAGRDRTRAGATAPAHGLALVAVKY